MLAALERLKNKVENLPVRDMMQEVTVANLDLIADLNVTQMAAGMRSDGTKIEPPYSEPYKKVKRRINQPTDRVTLRFSGAFHDDTQARPFDNGVELFSTDYKEPFLKARYGAKIFGLSSESKIILKETVLIPALREKTKQYFKQ